MSASERKKKKKDRRRQQLRQSTGGISGGCSGGLLDEEARAEEQHESALALELAVLMAALDLGGEQQQQEQHKHKQQQRRQAVPGVVRGLSVAATAAGSKRDRVERHRLLCSRALLALLGVSHGAHVAVRRDNTGGGGMRWLLATAWAVECRVPDQVQLSRSLKRAIEGQQVGPAAAAGPSGGTVCVRRLDHVRDAREVRSAVVRLEGSDRWARLAIAQSAALAHVKDYVRQTLVDQRVLAEGSTLGLSLNGYPCFCTVEHMDVFGTEAAAVAAANQAQEENDNDLKPLVVGLATPGMEVSIVQEQSQSAEQMQQQQPQQQQQQEGASAAGQLRLRVGGLESQVGQVLEVLQHSLNGDVGSSGRRVPRGVLLFGPPGTGKTLIARSAAAAVGARLVVLNGAEVVGRFVGHAEARVHEAFQQAQRQQPAVIFIDEIDALCPSRSASGNDQLHARIVAMLLQRMDALHQQQPQAGAGSGPVPVRVAVLAATNRVNAVDLALRRPGRFDREVEVGAPSAADRAEILGVLLARVPNAVAPAQAVAFADDLHGYVGADILALTREASWHALRRTFAAQPAGEEAATPLERVQVSVADLVAARKVTRPSALRELSVEVPRVRWDDVGGQDAVKQQLKEAVEWPLQRPEAFARMGVRPPQGVLLFGPPGCSKTLLAKAIATEGRMNFLAVKGPELFSKWVGESERAVHEVFAKARASEPAVVFFDEIDALAGSRGQQGAEGGGVADRVLSQLLLEMDGIEERKRVIVVAATNRPDMLDDALLRPGRLDRMAYVPPPEPAARAAVLAIHTRGVSLAPDVDLDRLAAHTTDGYSGAEIASLCREAAMAALQDNMDAQQVEAIHFERAATAVTKQITPQMIRFYQDFRDKRTR